MGELSGSCWGMGIQFPSRIATFFLECCWEPSSEHQGAPSAIWIVLCCMHLPGRPLLPEFVHSSGIFIDIVWESGSVFPSGVSCSIAYFVFCQYVSAFKVRASFLATICSISMLWVSHSEDTVSVQLVMVLAQFWDWFQLCDQSSGICFVVKLSWYSVKSSLLSSSDSFLMSWVYDLVRARRWILGHSGKCFSDLQLCDEVAVQAGLCQGSVKRFPDCFPFIQIVLITLLDKALE